MKKVIKHPKKMKKAMYIVFGVFALALFAITRIHPSYANEGLMIDEALDAIVLYGEVEQLPEDEEVEEVQDEKTQEIEQAQDIKKEDIVEPELTPEEKAEELDENSQDLENDEENLDGEEVDNRKNGENEDGDKEGKTEEIEGTSETEEGDNEPEVQIPEVSSDEENHGVGDNEPSEEAISEKNEQFSILTGNFVLKTADVGNTITITYNTNLGEFEGGENTKDVVYTYTEPTEGTKYSHTPNISDAGVQSGNYSDNLANNHTIGIPGSLKLHISLNYATEKSYDYLYIFKGTYTGTPTKNMKEGQLYTFNGDSSNTLKTSDFYVDGDEVTFSFYSDSSSNYYGYYATIEGIGGYVTDETVEKPVREGYSFMGWYETGAENPYDFSQKVTENKILYAKRDVAKTITYNANGGSFKSGTNSMITQDVIYTRQNDGTYIPDNNIQFPNKISDNMAAQSGWMFDGWYTSTTNQTASTEWTGYVNENTQSQTVYAKWLPFNDLKVDIGGTGFTIMDRNLGATSNDISSSNSYGKYYQWGNNYGFSTYDISLLNTSSTKVDETPYGPGNYYSSATYITTDDGIRTQDYDFGNLWGGNTNTDEAMQGPCPIGYHVSSSDDIWDVYEAFQYWVYHTDEGEEFCSNYDNNAECFSVKTHLPLAGYYDDYNKTTNQNDGYYWTSYKKSWPSALILMIESSDPYGGYPAINGFRMGGLLPVRCFKNAPQLFTVTFNPNGGEVEGESSLTTDNEGKVILPGATREPNENGERVFEGWFASTGVIEKIGNSGDVITLTEDMEVYAHWAQTITIFDPTNPLSGFTIMDRNLGAATTGYGADASTDSYGFHYQWGNNYGFDPNIDPSELPTSSVKVNVDGLTSYYSGVFIITNKSNENDKRHDTWMETNNNNLWNGDKIQGPCPEGWHIPSHDELNNLLIYWAKSNNVTWTTPDNSVKINSGHLKISNDLYIPYAGARNYDGSFLNRGNLGIFWSYSINGSSGLPYDFFTSNIDGTYVRNNDGRIRGLSVRCFRDEYVAPASSYTLILDANGGEVEGESTLTTDNEGKVILPGATREPNENGERVFEGWFASTGLSEKIGNSGDIITLAADMDVYAHWAQTITIFDPENPLVGFTILDRNLGAVSSGIDDVNSYGFYYQWGDNHGHLSGEEMTAIEARLEYKSEYNGHGYDGKEKRHINIAGYPDIWENNNSYPNLWGGGSDSLNESNGFVYGFSTGTYSVNNVTDRQGPCPDGYHVPSYGERAGILNLYYESINQTGLLSNYGTIDVSVSDGDKNFINALHLPYAGHTWSNFSTVSDDAGLMGYYWTSTPASNTYESLAKKINKSSGSVDHDRNSRAYGYSVRCFKNEYEAPAPQSVTVTYNANGGKFADNSTTTGIIYSAGTVINPKESLVPTKDGYIFTGWYTAINGGTEVTGHTVLESRELYAHWEDDITQTRREGCFQFRNLTDTTVEITDYSDSCSRNLADEGGIPSTITRGDKSYTVTSIGYKAFNPTVRNNESYKLIGIVVIPDTVKVISGYAFNSNNITGLVLGSGVEIIGEAAFQSNNISIPFSTPITLREIGDYAFMGNSNLTGVELKEGLISIGYNGFNGLKLEKIIIPSTVTSIGERAFGYNSLNEIIILPYEISIGDYAFNAYGGNLNNLVINGGGTIKQGMFDASSLKYLTIGTGVEIIGTGAFNGADITGVKIPDSVIFIGKEAFWNNESLEDIDIGNGVVTISDNVFNVTNLRKLKLGNSLKEIGDKAFYGGARRNLSGVETIEFPDSLETIGELSFGYLYHLKNVSFGTGLKSIGDSAFVGTSITGLVLPDSLESLGVSAICDDSRYDQFPGKVTGIVSKNKTDEYINSLEAQEGQECFVIERDKYNVKLSGANEGSDILVEVPYNTEFELSAYTGTRFGWIFTGWALDSVSTGALSDNPVVTGELVLYPIFRKDLVGTFNKDSSVSSITTNSATCTLWNNESSCTLTAPTINCANGYSNGVWSPLSMTISENTTFTASCNDVQKPVCNISTQPTRTLMSMVNGYNQGTVTFTCTDNVGVSTNNLSASNITYDGDVVTLSNFIVGGTSTSKTFTFTYTAKVAGNTSFTLKAGVVSDVAGNSNLVTSASNSVTVDTTAPVLSTKISFENIWYTANQTSTFTYTDTGAGITAGENTASCTISTEGIASTCQITPNICDKVGNCNTTFQTSNSIKLDKTAPVFTGKTQFTTGWYNTDQTSIFIYEDTVSGISGANTTSCVINEEGTAAKCTVENTNICNNAGLCNTANQTSNSIKLDKTNPTCSITGNPTSPINQDVELTLNYLVESNQISTGYSWDGEVYTSTQKFTVTQNGTYKGYVRDAAGNTGSCSVVVDKIDKNLPVITINNPDTTTAQSKTITATKNKGTLYMSITGANVCDSTLEFVAYAEITFNLESDNGKYVCYKAEDSAGNVVYKISNQIVGIKEPSKSSGGGGGTKKSETDTKEIAIETSDEQHNSADDGQETKTPEVGNTPSNEETSNQVISVTQEILEDGTPVEVVIQTVTIKNTDIVATVRTETVQSNTAKSSSSRFTKEENDAYSFAKSNGITTTDSIDNAKMNTELTRIQMAKMLSNFAINVLGEEPDVSKGIVKFDDVTNKMDDQYDNAVTKAYQLGIMGQNMKNNEFRPNDEVTRAEFASALSRLLYKTDEGKYRSTGKYYIPHVAKLYNEGIINKTDPKIKEKRGYVMLMLMRTVQ